MSEHMDLPPVIQASVVACVFQPDGCTTEIIATSWLTEHSASSGNSPPSVAYGGRSRFPYCRDTPPPLFFASL